MLDRHCIGRIRIKESHAERAWFSALKRSIDNPYMDWEADWWFGLLGHRTKYDPTADGTPRIYTKWGIPCEILRGV